MPISLIDELMVYSGELTVRDCCVTLQEEFDYFCTVY